MSFESFEGFLAMGGHGLYVWLAYGAALIIVLGNVASVRVARRRFFRQARGLVKRTGGTPGSAANPTSREEDEQQIVS